MRLLVIVALIVILWAVRRLALFRSGAIKNRDFLQRELQRSREEHNNHVDKLLVEHREELENAELRLNELRQVNKDLEAVMARTAPGIFEIYARATGLMLEYHKSESSAGLPKDRRQKELNEKLRTRCKKESRKRIEAEYSAAYYETLVPWLSDLRERDPEGVDVFRKSGESRDSAKLWLSDEEYAELPVAERDQLALERYAKRKRTRLEMSQDYERYLRWKYELKGYSVNCKGIVEGFEDFEHDLICKSKKSTLIIRCMCWSETRKIHERHVMQLFASTIHYLSDHKLPMRKANVGALLVTSTQLSSKAKDFANRLNIDYLERYPLKEYPSIKCQTGRKYGEKNYFLPFDRQYDRIEIEIGRGDFYTATVADAEAQGFRRASC